ncbi:hypothetical protein ACFODO_13665 [Acinetobacter sichuanensis]|nr:hypothetical protein [Acinetobacter sichuanensis]
MNFPTTALRHIHSGYIGTAEIWQQFFIEFIDNYENFKGENPEFDASDFSHLKAEYLNLIRHFDVVAIQNQLDKKEKDLGMVLPKSYKDFVLAGGIEISKNFTYDFLTYSALSKIENISYLKEDKKGFRAYHSIIEMNEEDYIENPQSLAQAEQNHYHYVNYFELFKLTGEERGNILDVVNIKDESEIGYFSRGTLPLHKEFKDSVINITEYLTRILLPFQQTQDGEYEAWLFEDGNFYRCKSFAEMYMIDLLGSCSRGLMPQGMKNLYRSGLSKMFNNMPEW